MSWARALLLFGLGVLTRLPFQADLLWAHDSVLYERAIASFSPVDQRPQPPGYLYYVLLLRVVDALTGDANRAMTIVAVVAGAASIALLYLLAARLYDERTGRVSALLLLTSLTFWGESVVAYPYALLCALTILCALLLWRARDGDGRALLVASAAYGVAIGFRFDLLVFLAPLWLLVAWRAPLAARIASAQLVGTLVLVWAGLSAWLDGGPAFFRSLNEQNDFVMDTYSVLGGRRLGALATNAYELARFLGRALLLMTPLIVAVVVSATERRLQLREPRRLVFLLLWTLTPLAIYLPVHVGEYGYVFSMLPGLAILGARGAIALARTLRRPRALAAIVGAVVLANAAIFLFSDEPLSASDIARHDASLRERFEYLRTDEQLDRATIIVAYERILVQRYDTVGTHNVLGYDATMSPPIEFRFAVTTCGPGAGILEGCAHSPVLAVWNDMLRVHGPGWTTVRLPHGETLRIARDAAGMRVRIVGKDVTLSP